MQRAPWAACAICLALGCSPNPTTEPLDSGTDIGDTRDDVLFDPRDNVVVPIDVLHSNDCAESARLVYVVSTQNDLWRFDPGTLTFARVGALDCPTTALPESMAIDRNARAYVAMADGTLFSVDTATAHCTATPYERFQSQRQIYDLAFSTDTGSGSAETLFTSTTCCWSSGGVTITNNGGGGLARIATPSLRLSLVGDYSGDLMGYPPALAGTGDARLFGYFRSVTLTRDGGSSAAAFLAEIDKATGATPMPIALDAPSLRAGGPFALAFWGGDFWFFTSMGMTASSVVTRFRYATDRSYSVVVQNTGMTIIGAGVSTCAPAIPP